jgi:hypothetical protein
MGHKVNSLNLKKIYFLHLTNSKLFSQIEGKSVNKRFFKKLIISVTPPGCKNLAAPLADYAERFNGCQREIYLFHYVCTPPPPITLSVILHSMV